MTDDTNYDVDFDEYETLEAEAETLARGDKEPVKSDRPSGVVPGRVGNSGRDAKHSSVTVVPAKDQSRDSLRRPSVAAQEQDNTENELEAMEEEEAILANEQNGNIAQQRPQKWVAFHQPEKMGLVNTETQEVIEGFKDLGSATGMAKMLNEIDSIIVSGGYQ